MAFPTSEELFNLSDEECIKTFKIIMEEQKKEIDILVNKIEVIEGTETKNINDELIKILNFLFEMIQRFFKEKNEFMENKEHITPRIGFF